MTWKPASAIGASSVDELFDQIPDGVRLRRELDLPPGMSEQDVYAHLLDLARRNTSAEDELTFLGADRTMDLGTSVRLYCAMVSSR
jgi:glycine cleavage system pyridoxal-binding protein P